MTDCIFCKIVEGKVPCHKIWEDKDHLAFLSIFPNTEGFSVVIPKKHYPSYAFDTPDDVLTKLVLAAKKTAQRLDEKLQVGRTALIFEGFGVHHLHAKLFPMHGTQKHEWNGTRNIPDKYFTQYEGYVSSHDHKRADDTYLADLAKKIAH